MKKRKSKLRCIAEGTGVASMGCLALILYVVIIYVVSVLWWSYPIMVLMGAFGPYHWGYFYVVTHWGLLAPFVLA